MWQVVQPGIRHSPLENYLLPDKLLPQHEGP